MMRPLHFELLQKLQNDLIMMSSFNMQHRQYQNESKGEMKTEIWDSLKNAATVPICEKKDIEW